MILTKIKKDIYDRLKADRFFSNVKVIASDKGDIEIQVETLLSTLGLSVVIEIPNGKVEFLNVGSGSISNRVVFTIEETPIINRAKDGFKTAEDAMERIFIVFNPLQPGVAQPCKPVSWEQISNTGGKVGYQVVAEIDAGWQEVAT